jgi:hypothetical protein
VTKKATASENATVLFQNGLAPIMPLPSCGLNLRLTLSLVTLFFGHGMLQTAFRDKTSIQHRMKAPHSMVAISLAVGLIILICAGPPRKLSVLPDDGVAGHGAEIISPLSQFRGETQDSFANKRRTCFSNDWKYLML